METAQRANSWQQSVVAHSSSISRWRLPRRRSLLSSRLVESVTTQTVSRIMGPYAAREFFCSCSSFLKFQLQFLNFPGAAKDFSDGCSSLTRSSSAIVATCAWFRRELGTSAEPVAIKNAYKLAWMWKVSPHWYHNNTLVYQKSAESTAAVGAFRAREASTARDRAPRRALQRAQRTVRWGWRRRWRWHKCTWIWRSWSTVGQVFRRSFSDTARTTIASRIWGGKKKTSWSIGCFPAPFSSWFRRRRHSVPDSKGTGNLSKCWTLRTSVVAGPDPSYTSWTLPLDHQFSTCSLLMTR